MPSTSSSGRASASVIASASSWPGSQSSRTGIGAATAGARTPRRGACANRPRSMTMPTSALGVRPSRRRRYGRPSHTVRPRAGPSVVSTVDVVAARRRRGPGPRGARPPRRRGSPSSSSRDHSHVAVEREVGELRGDPRRTACPCRAAPARDARSSSAWWVTSRPIIVIGTPERNTTSAASGSAKMLNSAETVVFPSPIEPPMRHRWAIFGDEVRVQPQQQRDVGQRPDRRDRDRLRVRREDPGDERRPRRSGCARRRRRVELRVADPALAVDLGRPDDRARAARRPRPRRPGRRPGRRRGAAAGRSRCSGSRRRCRRPWSRPAGRAPGSGDREADRQRVVEPGVAVDDQRQRVRRRSRTAPSAASRRALWKVGIAWTVAPRRRRPRPRAHPLSPGRTAGRPRPGRARGRRRRPRR